MDSLEEVLLETEDRMIKCNDHLRTQFSALRTGKASPALVENITVPYYGTPTRLREIAGISTPEPRLIVINSYDPNALKDIEKAILGANVGVTPVSDGKVIRIPIPELSQERRAEITKVAKRMSEEARVAVRNVRRDMNEAIKELQKGSKITEDARDLGLKEIQKFTDDYIKKIDDTLEAKEKEVMAV
ncbi:MAG: ribosome recycling factor [bacterium]